MKTFLSFDKSVRHSFFTIAIPISLQSLFQSSLSVIDQIMVGTLGMESITAIGLASKFFNLYQITLTAIGTAASIMISQYYGSANQKGINRSFLSNGILALIVAVSFFLPSALIPKQIMGIYTADAGVIQSGAGYLGILSISYIPLLCTTMLSAILRNIGYAKSPMAASILSVITNTLLNYILIFGKLGAPKLGINGSAIATTCARIIECAIILTFFYLSQRKRENKIYFNCSIPPDFMKQALLIAAPIVMNEFLWGLGDTLYSVIYGHIGTNATAAMTLTYPIQSLSIGLFSGVSAAAAIIIGNYLGKSENAKAYLVSRNFILIGFGSSIGFGCFLMLFFGWYSNLFNVPESIKQTTVSLLMVFSVVFFAKVSNMILGGGILRSGGNTKYTLFLDTLGTWGIGIPLGLITAFLLHFSIVWVYFFISLEEIVRFLLSLLILKSKKWISNITDHHASALNQ